MIDIRYDREGCSLVLKGHAGREACVGESNLVCAAASVLFYTLWAHMRSLPTVFGHVEMHEDPAAESYIRWHRSTRQIHDCCAVILSGYEALAAQYPYSVRVTAVTRTHLESSI